jgi:hypothetical protein
MQRDSRGQRTTGAMCSLSRRGGALGAGPRSLAAPGGRCWEQPSPGRDAAAVRFALRPADPHVEGGRVSEPQARPNRCQLTQSSECLGVLQAGVLPTKFPRLLGYPPEFQGSSPRGVGSSKCLPPPPAQPSSRGDPAVSFLVFLNCSPSLNEGIAFPTPATELGARAPVPPTLGKWSPSSLSLSEYCMFEICWLLPRSTSIFSTPCVSLPYPQLTFRSPLENS